MSGTTHPGDGLDRALSLLERTARAIVLTGLVVALLCAIGLMLAATYGILHNGDDFDFGNDFHGLRGGAGSDVIHVPGVLS